MQCSGGGPIMPGPIISGGGIQVSKVAPVASASSNNWSIASWSPPKNVFANSASTSSSLMPVSANWLAVISNCIGSMPAASNIAFAWSHSGGGCQPIPSGWPSDMVIEENDAARTTELKTNIIFCIFSLPNYYFKIVLERQTIDLLLPNNWLFLL